MIYNNFHYAQSLLETMFGISLNEEEFEEIALIGWNLIGNKRCKLYRAHICMSPGEEYIELPCNCDILEAVTADFEDFVHTDNISPGSRIGSHATEEYIERRKHFQLSLYARGKFVNYERVGNKLYFKKDCQCKCVNILYRGLVLDNDGLPEITDKEALALATYVAWVQKFKEGLQTSNANIIKLADMLKLQWNTRCDQARIDHEFTQNDYDEILDAKTNWDRKLYNRSLKLIR